VGSGGFFSGQLQVPYVRRALNFVKALDENDLHMQQTCWHVAQAKYQQPKQQ
jgi:hypothetical protein